MEIIYWLILIRPAISSYIKLTKSEKRHKQTRFEDGHCDGEYSHRKPYRIIIMQISRTLFLSIWIKNFRSLLHFVWINVRSFVCLSLFLQLCFRVLDPCDENAKLEFFLYLKRNVWCSYCGRPWPIMCF